ncbi:ABC transporter permease, partial [Cronobacter sakazakii]|nr:ABC transporter permease [Cronobacter sakazakii]
MAQLPPVRPEYQRETALPGALPLDTPLPLTTRLWNQAWVRKTLLVIV